jgi:hypothetical protein
MPSWFSKAASL